jgi:hypothetical protein
MKNDNLHRLADEIIFDDQFRSVEAETFIQARGVLHRRRHLRQLSHLALCSILVIGAIFTWNSIQPHSGAPSVAAQVPNIPPLKPNLAAAARLTDEQLLASFPPGTCALAEINGRQVLVFHNPEDRQRYLSR